MARILKFMSFWVLVYLVPGGLHLFLNHGLDFHIAVSPAWQVGLFYLTLLPVGLMWFAASVYLLLPRVAGWKWLASGLGILVLAGVLALGWWEGGAYSDIRDRRVEDLTVVFGIASAFAVVLVSGFRLVWSA